MILLWRTRSDVRRTLTWQVNALATITFMPSAARMAFDASCKDVERLLEIHEQLGGTGAGRRRRLEVLNKSAIVLLAALWEAYCEDLASEAIGHLVAHVSHIDRLPNPLKQKVAKELKTDLNELAVWQLAEDGWRSYLTDRLDTLREERNRRLNTPKTNQINELFGAALGLTQVSRSWFWPGMSPRQAATKLDEYIELRGSIAHRGSATRAIRKFDVTDFFDHVTRLVGKTGGRVNRLVKESTGTGLW